MNLPKFHQVQIDAGIRESLTRANVPRDFMDRSLTEVTGDNEIARTAREACERGGAALRGTFFSVEAPRVGLRSLFLLARAFHLMGGGYRFVLAIQGIETHNYDGFHENRSTPLLCVQRFHLAAASPTDVFQRMQIEGLSLELFAESKSVMLRMVGTSRPEQSLRTQNCLADFKKRKASIKAVE